MTGFELIELLDNAYRRWHLIGNMENGVIAALIGRIVHDYKRQVVKGSPQPLRNVPIKCISKPGGDAFGPPLPGQRWVMNIRQETARSIRYRRVEGFI